MVMLAISLDPSRSLYSLAPLVLVAILAPSGGPEDVEVVDQRVSSRRPGVTSTLAAVPLASQLPPSNLV
jgi:hypothetical protein